MDGKDLKSILAGITISSLLAGSALFLGGCNKAGTSGWGGTNKGAGSAPAKQERPEQPPGKSGWSGTDNGAVSAPATPDKPEQPPGKSGWGGTQK